MFSGGFNFTNPPASTATNQPIIGLGSTMPAAATTSAIGTTGFTLGATTAATTAAATQPASIFSFGTNIATSTPAAATTSAAAAPIVTPATAAPTISLGLSTAPTVSLNTATTTTTSATVNTPQMNFRQLQELINKWTIELEEQEKIFIEQATKVNAWDRTLMANGDKISKLSESVDKVKQDHVRLEHTLDYLKGQQQEFEGYLEVLEASLPANTAREPEREYLYNLAESMDTQLQQMAEDLKDVIRYINDTNKPVEKAEPVAQILKILNEHTDALQWVEDNITSVKKSVDDVTKLHQMFRRDHERSLRLMSKN